MRILIIGSGGREHALAWKIKQQADAIEVFIAPGNGGTAQEGQNIPIDPSNIPALVKFIKEKRIDFVIPGPELPLVNGIVDACKKMAVQCFGPSAYCAQLEGSKSFAKNIMRASCVPTADFQEFNDHEKAALYVQKRDCPLVIKADGLAAGKGVVVAKNAEEALQALHLMMHDKEFGTAGEKVIIEETLVGEEVSLLAFCDGETVLPLPSAQDHKAVFDNDKGPNTGGMGAYSPAPLLQGKAAEKMVDIAIRPILKTLKEQGQPFSGILYAGLMMTKDGPMVLEYNVRFGDPECQPLLMRLEGNLLETLLLCASGRLSEAKLTYTKDSALCVVVAAKGYPADYPKGMPISGIQEAEAASFGKTKVFHAGTQLRGENIVASGGRILGVTSLGVTLKAAQKNAYAALEHIQMQHIHFRQDIGNKGFSTRYDLSGEKD